MIDYTVIYIYMRFLYALHICRKSMNITIRPPLDTPTGGTKLACEANWFDADGRSSQMIHPFERDIYVF